LYSLQKKGARTIKNDSTSTLNEHGFAFPLLLLILTFTFLVFNSSLLQLQTSQIITANEKEQLHLETLFQMGNASFQKEKELIYEELQEGQKSYSFPYGVVFVQYVVKDKDYIQTQFTMETSNGSKRIVRRRIFVAQ